MTPRDRKILVVLGLVAVLAAFWGLALAPRRAESQKLSAEVAQARQTRDDALASARVALNVQRGHSSDQAIIARLGEAVPGDDNTASLVYQIEAAADRAHVNFRSVHIDGSGAAAPPAAAPAPTTSTTTSTTTPAGAGTLSPTQAAAAPLPPGAMVGPAGFFKLPLVLSFEGNIFGLERFLRTVYNFTAIKGTKISVRGRLLAVDGISLTAAPSGFPRIKASLTVSAFIAPAAMSSVATPASMGLTADASAPTTAQAVPTTTATVVAVGG